MTSRRLSRGCGIIQEVPGNDDEAERERLRAQREKRRLSHTPTARRRLSGAIAQVEPDRNVLEIYDRCIKLSAENKINRQNTWDLSLIDHIDDVIGRTGANTNFQKASCTLDASVKIYSYRVDSVHHDMFKVLGGLNRTDENDDDQEDQQEADQDNDDDDDAMVESSAATTRPRQRNRQQLLNCHLELRPTALSVPLSELLFEVDPMFQRTASSFDEGGAKGLLMNQLNVGQRCHIVFDFSADMEMDADGNTDTNGQFEIHSTFVSLCSNLHISDLHISPLTSKLRSALNDTGSNSSIDDSFDDLVGLAEPNLMDETREIPDSYTVNDDDFDDDNDDGGVPFTVDSQEVDGFDNHEPFPVSDDDENREEFGETFEHELNENEANRDKENRANDAGLFSPAFSRRATALFGDANGLNLPNLQLNKNWAGPGIGMSHWRFKGESQRADPNLESELDVVNARLKRTRIACEIDFRAPPVPESDLADPIRASNILSKASQTKSSALNHLLPTDLHISQSVLFRLFHRPSFFLRPGRIHGAGGNIQADGDGCYANSAQNNFATFDDDFDDGVGFNSALGDDDEPNREAFASEFNFVAQPATAEKIELDFAKSVKKVDIKAVKHCLWSTLSEKTRNAPPLVIENQEEREGIPDNERCEDVPESENEWPSFKEMIETVPVPDTSREAMSVQLYFICLLHLANENDLVLKPRATPLGDFSIGRRASSPRSPSTDRDT